MSNTIATGRIAPTAADGFASKPTVDEQKALARLYNGNSVQPAPAAGNPAAPDLADRMYGPSLLTGTIDRRGAELWAKNAMPPAQQRALRDTFVGIAQRTGLPEPVLLHIANGHIDNLLAEMRVEPDPDAAQLALHTRIEALNTELRQDFRLRYGATAAEALLNRTQRFVRAHPDLARILQQRGLGSKREIVEGIAAHVFSSGWQ
jgi:hypothetical protein